MGVLIDVVVVAATMICVVALLRTAVSARHRYQLRRIERRARDRISRRGPLSRSDTVGPPAPELVELIASGDAVLCVGPELSVHVGVPTVGQLLQQITVEAEDRGLIGAQEAGTLLTSLRDGRTDAVADELNRYVDDGLWRRLIEEGIGHVGPGEPHLALADLSFGPAISLNYDRLLEEALDRKGVRVAEIASAFDGSGEKERETAATRSEQSVIRLRGGSRDGYLITREEVKRDLDRHKLASQYLSALFVTHGHFFIGMSLEDVRGYLECIESTDTPIQRHFAFVSTAVDVIEARYLARRYNLEVAHLNRRDTVGFLQDLRSSVRLAEGPGSDTPRPVLDHVYMENIGPFVQLDLALQDGWNVLLGNNGMGKSVVLRAIATALCSDLVDERLAGKLLRSGASQGRIQLRSGTRTYTTELVRTGDRVHLASFGPSPLYWDDWLVLGFPALRSMPAERPLGPTVGGFVGPLIEDVIPLLSGEPDTRIGDLKQWLIDLDYTASAPGSEGRRAARIRDRFFEVLGQLMPDIGLELHRIDRAARRIDVKTRDAVVPLEAVSQGTAAVMAWVGTLLERLYEVSGDDGRDGAALVLIDEIDAHMHPEWQRRLVERLRDLFPNVQVLATTHSPLIVGSMDPGGVLIARRDVVRARIDGVVELPASPVHQSDWIEVVVRGAEVEQREFLPPFSSLLVKAGERVSAGSELSPAKVIRMVPLDIDLRGWRADQILTGPAFALDSARDTQTERMMEEYTALAALDEPDEHALRAMESLGAQLGVRVPTPLERENARQAFRLIRESIEERISELGPDRQKQLVDEIKVQLQESETGSRRPR